MILAEFQVFLRQVDIGDGSNVELRRRQSLQQILAGARRILRDEENLRPPQVDDLIVVELARTSGFKRNSDINGTRHGDVCVQRQAIDSRLQLNGAGPQRLTFGLQIYGALRALRRF